MARLYTWPPDAQIKKGTVGVCHAKLVATAKDHLKKRNAEIMMHCHRPKARKQYPYLVLGLAVFTCGARAVLPRLVYARATLPSRPEPNHNTHKKTKGPSLCAAARDVVVRRAEGSGSPSIIIMYRKGNG